MNDTGAPVGLEWSMAVHGQTLQVKYTLSNHTTKEILVFDSLLVRGGEAGTYRSAPGRAVVMETEPGVAGFFLCAASPMNPIAWLVPPLAQPLAAGASVSGSFEVALPLAPWHNLGAPGAFSTEPKTATLRVAYLADEPKWHDLKGEGGAVVRVAMNASLATVAGDAQPIPSR